MFDVISFIQSPGGIIAIITIIAVAWYELAKKGKWYIVPAAGVLSLLLFWTIG